MMPGFIPFPSPGGSWIEVSAQERQGHLPQLPRILAAGNLARYLRHPVVIEASIGKNSAVAPTSSSASYNLLP